MENKFTIDAVRSFWDHAAQKYETENEKVGYVHYQRYEKALEYGNLKPGQKVLNVWSRMGSLLPYLRRTERLEITNREVSPVMIAIAQKRYHSEDFNKTDLKDFSEFHDNHFDRIISLETLEHVPHPQHYISELARILKPGGRLVLSTPGPGAEILVKIYETFFGGHGEGPHRFLPTREVECSLKTAGLNLIKSQPFLILPFGSDQFRRWNERILTTILGSTPFAYFAYRRFYICEK